MVWEEKEPYGITQQRIDRLKMDIDFQIILHVVMIASLRRHLFVISTRPELDNVNSKLTKENDIFFAQSVNGFSVFVKSLSNTLLSLLIEDSKS